MSKNNSLSRNIIIEANTKIRSILDKLPNFEDNVKRYSDILILVNGWKLNSSEESVIK